MIPLLRNSHRHSEWASAAIYICTGIPCFPKVHLMPFHFYERTLVPVFIKQKKSKEDFCFYKKNTKSENSIQHLFFSELLQQVNWHVPLSSKVALNSFLEKTQPLSIKSSYFELCL